MNVSNSCEDTAVQSPGYKYGYNSSAAALAIFDDNQLKNIKKKDLDKNSVWFEKISFEFR